jgi:hypothetical protein
MYQLYGHIVVRSLCPPAPPAATFVPPQTDWTHVFRNRVLPSLLLTSFVELAGGNPKKVKTA